MERVPDPIQASNMGESEIEPEMDGAGDGGEVSQGEREDGRVAEVVADPLSAEAAIDAGGLTQ